MGLNNDHNWTDERIALARQLYVVEGLNASKVAKRLGGISRNGVIGKLARMGFRREAEGTSSQALGGRVARGLLPSANERRASGGGAFMHSQAKAPDLSGLPQWADDSSDAGLPLSRLGRRHCKWPLGPLLAPSNRFCAEPVRDADCPYCSAHATRAFQRADPAKIKKSDSQALYIAARMR